jgi:DNA polymerase
MIFLDFETRSRADLPKTGVSRYAEDESTNILCVAWAVDEEEVQLWHPGQPPPHELFNLIPDHRLCAWNAEFEMEIWKVVAQQKLFWPQVDHDQWACIMTDAMVLGLPANLEKCSQALGLSGKLKTGKTLINKLSKPISSGKKKGEFREQTDFPEDYINMYLYCREDVRAERRIFNKIPYHATL